MLKKESNSVIRRLQVLFAVSTVILLISLIASFYSINQLIENSHLVNHTNEVLRQSELIISHMKDAETGQRGYILTREESFLEPYKSAYGKVMDSYRIVQERTLVNPKQQQKLVTIKKLIDDRFEQMKLTLEVSTKSSTLLTENDYLMRLNEMRKGKLVMDELRLTIESLKSEEIELLNIRSELQTKYISYTPFLVLMAALISVIITVMSYFRIKADLDQRLALQRLEEQKYQETADRITVLEEITQKIADGDYTIRSNDESSDQLGRVSTALNKMAVSLQNSFNDLNIRNWIQEGIVAVSNSIRGERDIRKLSSNLIQTIANYLNAPLGAVYVLNRDMEFVLTGAYATNNNIPYKIKSGEGLTGEVIKNRKVVVIEDLSGLKLNVNSSLAEVKPESLILLPLSHDSECIGIIEIAMLRKLTSYEKEWLEQNLEPIAIGINAALSYERLQELYEEMQAQAEELQAQHNELESLNTELEAQTQKLQASEEELKVQQEELQQTNGELEERTLLLEERNHDIRKKTEELEQSTRYKSEFLANMSHELRTPLNSILLLSRLLAENGETNLSTDQIEYARVIQSSGQGLLGLIDEILDLSKIEAGKMEVEYLKFPLNDLVEEMNGLFKPIANEKNLELIIQVNPNAPKMIETDKVRLSQILKNLLSNALKFTSKGYVELLVNRFPTNENVVCFTVKDTGIGIPVEKQAHIFEAFQQADGSTRRKYGGTGLGLSISKELVKLLGGELKVTSTPEEGSEFTIYLPAGRPELGKAITNKEEVNVLENKVSVKSNVSDEFISRVIPDGIPDDRDNIVAEDKVILIVEDDIAFAKALLKYTREKGYKGIVAVRGDDGLYFAQTYKPIGILLDLQLPIKSGWQIMDELKTNPVTRHIPVHIMSSHNAKSESLRKGAIDFINKPFMAEHMQEIFSKIEYVLNRNSNKVMIVEENSMHAKALAYFLETYKIHSEVKSDIKDSIAALQEGSVDCVILDMGIPDSTAYEILEEAKKNPGLENLPIIVFTGKSLSIAEEQRIKQYADSIIVKTAHSYKRMLDEISLFLHLVEENKQKSDKTSETRNLGALNEVLNNKTVLVADDDVRNIFSLSKALEKFQMNIITAIDGKEALQKLNENSNIDVVLLDMMMPQMDGYETARRIRSESRWKKLPVIAVTAKAMTGDREKCINAGASDYITKPVDIDQLLSLLRVWLYENNY